MALTKRQLRTILIVSIVVGATIVPIAAAVFLSNSVQVQNGVTLHAPSGPAVNITETADVNMTDPFPSSDTVDIQSSKGNITLSSNGRTNATLDQINGTWTNVSAIDADGTKLTINPEDKQKVALNGPVDRFDFHSMSLDDSTIDFIIAASSGQTTVTIHGLPSDQTITAINDNTGNPVGVSTTDNSGVLTIDIQHSTKPVRLVSGDQTTTPSLSNEDPADNKQLSSPPSQLAVDINDSDFQDDSVDVTISLDGSQIKSTTISSNSTVSTSNFSSLTGGQHNWTVTATDSFGNSVTQEYSFIVPDTLQIRNATNPDQFVKGGVTVEVTFFGDDNVVTRSTTTGNISLEGLPVGESFVAVADAGNYFDRRVYIGSIYQQQAIYLLHTNFSAVQVDFALDDSTGEFEGEPTTRVLVQRAINQSGNVSYRTMYGSRIGANNEISTILQQDARYRLVIENSEQRRVLGAYTASSAGTETIPIGQINLEGSVNDEGYAVQGAIRDENAQNYIRVVYEDADSQTTKFVYGIWNTTANPDTQVYGNITVTRDLGTFAELAPIGASNKTYEIRWRAERGGETISGRVQLGKPQSFFARIPLDPYWANLIGYLSILGVAGLLVIFDGRLGAIGAALTAVLLTWVGVLTIPAWALAPAVGVALIFAIGGTV